MRTPPGGPQEAPGRRPGGAREAPGRRPGGPREAPGRLAKASKVSEVVGAGKVRKVSRVSKKESAK